METKTKSPMEDYVKKHCDVNWDEMSWMKNGRYCKVCKDKVLDLSTTTEEEQQAIYGKGSCVMIEITHLAATNRTKKIKQFAIASFLIVGTSLYTSASELPTLEPEFIQQISDSITVKGIVVHKEERDKPYKDLHLTCTVKDIEYSAYTDENGEYTFSIPANSGQGTIKVASFRSDNHKAWSFNAETIDLTPKLKKTKYIPRFVGSF